MGVSLQSTSPRTKSASVAPGGSVDDWDLRLHRGGLNNGFLDGHVDFMGERKLLPSVRNTHTRLTRAYFDPVFREQAKSRNWAFPPAPSA